MKVLVASNDQNYRQTVEAVFQHPRIELVFVGNSIKTLKDCDSSHFNLILFDAPSVLKAGLAALKTIRQNENRNGSAKTPIICTLDQTLMTEKQVFLEAGMDAEVQKPLQKKVLAATVISWLKANIANNAQPAA